MHDGWVVTIILGAALLIASIWGYAYVRKCQGKPMWSKSKSEHKEKKDAKENVGDDGRPLRDWSNDELDARWNELSKRYSVDCEKDKVDVVIVN